MTLVKTEESSIADKYVTLDHEDFILDLAEDIVRLVTMINVLEHLGIECKELKLSLNNYISRWLSLFIGIPYTSKISKYIEGVVVKPLWTIIDDIGEDAFYELLVKLYTYYELYEVGEVNEDTIKDLENILYIMWSKLASKQINLKVELNNMNMAIMLILYVLSLSTINYTT